MSSVWLSRTLHPLIMSELEDASGKSLCVRYLCENGTEPNRASVHAYTQGVQGIS